jgi:hypothetical protein
VAQQPLIARPGPKPPQHAQKGGPPWSAPPGARCRLGSHGFRLAGWVKRAASVDLPLPQEPYTICAQAEEPMAPRTKFDCWLLDAEDAEGVRWEFFVAYSGEPPSRDERREWRVIGNKELAPHCISIGLGWSRMNEVEPKVQYHCRYEKGEARMALDLMKWWSVVGPQPPGPRRYLYLA